MPELKKHNFFKRAFTLAEVLVTLSIIGIVSAMTIPTLHQRQTEKVSVNKVKKFYSTLNQSFQKAIVENGESDNWLLTGNSREDALLIYDYVIKNKFKIMTECGFENKNNCVYNGNYLYFNGDKHWNYASHPSLGFYKLILNDGSSVFFTADNKNMAFYIDVNGPAKPNRFGHDLFSFAVKANKVLPSGFQDSDYAFDKSCKSTQNGIGCTAWLIYKGNMEYKYCDDLEWNGKQKCSK